MLESRSPRRPEAAASNSSIVIYLGATPHSLTRPEVDVLQGRLSETSLCGGESLAASLRKEVDAARSHGVRLGLDDIAAVREVLSEHVLGDAATLAGLPGLEALRTALGVNGGGSSSYATMR